MKKSMDIGFIYAIGAAVMWGLVYCIDQKILTNVPPLALVFINSILAGAIMIPFMLFDRDSIKLTLLSHETNWFLIITAIALAALANFLIFSGIKNLDASTASIIEITYPFFIAIFSFFLFRSTLNIFFFIGSLLIFAGSIIIIKFT